MRTLLAILATLAVSAAALAIDEEGFEDPELNARYRALISEIRCMKCQNQSIADSPIDVAADLRRQVREMMAMGESDAAIKSYLSSRYGDFILYRPPLKPATWALWGGPAALLLIGGLVFFRLLKSYAGRPIEADEEP